MVSGLTGCVVAMNEADRIGDCLASLSFCDEIIVVDSHSTDATREIAADAGARVIERDWPGFGPQKEFAIREAAHDWILLLDADERVSDALRVEIEALRDAEFPDHAGWEIPRLSSYLGEWVRYGTWYPDRQLRLFDRRSGRFGGREPHATFQADGPVGRLRGDIEHHPYRDLEEHLRTMDRYTTIMANEMAERGRRASIVDLVGRPAVRFFRFYVLGRGFLHGWRGLLLASLAAHYVRMKYAKLLAMQRSGDG